MHDATQPSRYRIVVRGRLGAHFASAFDEFEVASQDGQSSLTGTCADQAQLQGLLDRIRDLGMTLVSVNPID